MMAYQRSEDLTDEVERHTWRVRPARLLGISLLSSSPAADITFSSTETVSTWDCSSSDCYTYLAAAQWGDEEELLRLEALAMKQRDLGYLYRPLLPRLHVVLRRVPRVIFQPCWSKRRWKSLT
jgi:hypothetical protein